jgi:hypothetical protein
MGLKLSKSIFVVAAFLLLCGLGSLFRVPGAIAREEGIKEYKPSAFMVIEAKSRHAIVASKRQFEITKETRIFDGSGQEIRIQNLPVPCKAQVDYETFTYGDPVVLKILIKKVFPGASTNWSDSLPE